MNSNQINSVEHAIWQLTSPKGEKRVAHHPPKRTEEFVLRFAELELGVGTTVERLGSEWREGNRVVSSTLRVKIG